MWGSGPAAVFSKPAFEQRQTNARYELQNWILCADKTKDLNPCSCFNGWWAATAINRQDSIWSIKVTNKVHTVLLLQDSSVFRRNEALEVKHILLGRLFFFIHGRGNHFSHEKSILNSCFELRHAEEQGVLDCFLHCAKEKKNTQSNTHTHRHTLEQETKPRGSLCLLPLEIGVCVQITSPGIRLKAQSLVRRKHLQDVEQFSSPLNSTPYGIAPLSCLGYFAPQTFPNCSQFSSFIYSFLNWTA